MNDSDSSKPSPPPSTPDFQNDDSGLPIAPHRQPSNWQFSTLLRQVREKRHFSVEEASECLPGISAKRYQDWELGRRLPFGTIQTFVIWKLNTSPRPQKSSARQRQRDNRSGSILSAGLPAAAFATTALATLIYHFSQPNTPDSLAGIIAQSAPSRFLEKASPEAYAEYAEDLKATLLAQFDADARGRIFREHASVAESLLSH